MQVWMPTDDPLVQSMIKEDEEDGKLDDTDDDDADDGADRR